MPRFPEGQLASSTLQLFTPAPRNHGNHLLKPHSLLLRDCMYAPRKFISYPLSAPTPCWPHSLSTSTTISGQKVGCWVAVSCNIIHSHNTLCWTTFCCGHRLCVAKSMKLSQAKSSEWAAFGPPAHWEF